MDIDQALNIVTCVTSIVTMIVVCVAATPHIKNGMVVVRDAILWAALVLVVSGIGWMGFQRLGLGEFVAPVSHGDDGPKRSFLPPDDFYAGR